MFGQPLRDSPRRIATHFFIGDQQHAHRPRQSTMQNLQRLNGMQHERDARLHIKHARPIQGAFLQLARHLRQRSKLVDSIEMAQQQNGLGLGHSCLRRKISLQMIAKFFLFVECYLAAKLLKSRTQPLAELVDGSLVVARRFHLDHLTNGFAERTAPRLKVLQVVGHRALNSFCRCLHPVSPERKWLKNLPPTRGIQYNLALEELHMTDTTQIVTEAPAAEKTLAAPNTILMDANAIMRILPHRFPFLLIDRIVELNPKERIVALKNVTINEPFFQGHFPELPIMPGVLVVEAMAQAGGVLLMSQLPDRDSQLVVFTGIERARFRRPVVPGDQLRIEVDVVAWRKTAGRMQGTAFVNGKRVAEATISCAVVPRKNMSS